MKNLLRWVFFSNILKQSDNYLPFTKREKCMIKWFIKFEIMTIVIIGVWFFLVLTIDEHLEDYKKIIKENSTLKAKEVKAEIQPAQDKQLFTVLDQFTGTVYAYNSFESQTDGDPCIGAFGYICDKKNVVANNCYLPGTIVEINGIKYKVYDRMNSRYGCDVFDIYMGMDYQAAKNHGVKYTKVKILRINK